MRSNALLAAVVLAGCASNPAKVPLAPGEKLLSDRIDALESDIEQLHAEMQELRTEYLPIEEMSEDEFERHVEKRLAKLPVDQREAAGKELRARRKNATLSGKGLADYWDTRFANEPTDDPWSKQATEACKPRVEETIASVKGKLVFFECRKERCRIEIDAPAESNPDMAVADICKSQPGDEEMFGETATTSHVVRTNARLHAVVFLTRKGFSMKIE